MPTGCKIFHITLWGDLEMYAKGLRCRKMAEKRNRKGMIGMTNTVGVLVAFLIVYTVGSMIKGTRLIQSTG